MANILDNFLYFEGLQDEQNNNIIISNENSFEKILEFSLLDNNIIGVTTNKELKFDFTFLTKSNNPNDGIFIKKNSCQKILDNLKMSNNYLQIDNINEIDEFIEKIYFDGPDGKTIIFTNANSWYMETLVLNLIYSYNQFNKNPNRKIGVFCSDKEAYEKAKILNLDCCMINCEKMKINNSLTNVTDEEYRRLSFTKTLIIDYLISKDYTVLYIDPDMSFNYKRYSDLDFIDEILRRKHSINYSFDFNNSLTNINDFDIKVDNIMAGSMYKNLENNISTIYLNSNLMLILPSIYNKFLYKIYINIFEHICQKMVCGGDETYINRVGKNQKYFSFWDEKYYPNGINSNKYKNYAYMFHANCVKGLNNKIQLLKNCGGWYLDFIPVIKTLTQWQTLIKNENELIYQASTEDGSDSITFCTVGLWYGYAKKNVSYTDCQIGEHKNLVLCSFSSHTDQNRRNNLEINRTKILNNLKNNNIINQSFEIDDFYKLLPTYKFIISPEGNGIDCHRHYEALIAGCIPIIEYNDIIRNKYGDCPILYTKDYSEITNEYLEEKYQEMKDRFYNFSKLYLSYFSDNEQQIIKNRGNFWGFRCLNKIWYKN
jgi:hypothetical protein